MSKISEWIPGISNSYTKRYMDYKPSNKEVALTLLAAGITAGAFAYFKGSERSFLALGTVCYISSQGLLKGNTTNHDVASQEDSSEALMCVSKEIPSHHIQLPIRAIHMVAVSYFFGLCVKESFTRPVSPILNTTWTAFLIKAPFYKLSFDELTLSLQENCKDVGKLIYARVKTNPTDQEKLITLIAVLIVSTSASYFAPSFRILMGTVTMSALLGAGKATINEAKDANDIIESGLPSTKIASTILLACIAGGLLRSYGHKDYSLAYSKLGKLGLFMNHLDSLVSLGAAIFLLKPGLIQGILDQIGTLAPQLEVIVDGFSKGFEAAFQNRKKYIALETLEQLEGALKIDQEAYEALYKEFTEMIDALIEKKEHYALEEGNMEAFLEKPQEVVNSFSNILILIGLIIIREDTDVTTHVALHQLEAFIEKALDFYKNKNGRAITGYTPVQLEKESATEGFEDRLQAITKPGRESQNYTKKQAAYLFLADPNNLKMIRNNYKKLLGVYHPDKNDSSEIATEKSKAITKAYEVLTK